MLYFTSNRQGFIPAHFLPLTGVDRSVPLMPWTSWIYSAVFIMPLWPCLVVERDQDVRDLCVSFAIMTTACSLTFFLYPTIYPRPALQAGTLGAFPLVIVRALDTAKNCFPSQHVSAAFLSAFHVRRHRKAWGAAALALAAAIALSTLTTKQHYGWDVAGGFLVACAAYALACR